MHYYYHAIIFSHNGNIWLENAWMMWGNICHCYISDKETYEDLHEIMSFNARRRVILFEVFLANLAYTMAADDLASCVARW